MAILILLLVLLVLIILPAYVIYKPPTFVIDYFQTRFPNVLFHLSTSRKIVALTIDDVPSEYTPQILEILKANNAHATFFVIGNQVAGRESILADIVRSGSELGNHAMHDEPSISLSNDTLMRQIDQVDSIIDDAYKAAGEPRTSYYFRPGSGLFSKRILDVVAEAKYNTVLGSIYPHDPFIKYWRLNALHILSMIKPGAIIICHDRRSWTIPMLRKVVPEMKRRGYEVVTVSELLEISKD